MAKYSLKTAVPALLLLAIGGGHALDPFPNKCELRYGLPDTKPTPRQDCGGGRGQMPPIGILYVRNVILPESGVAHDVRVPTTGCKSLACSCSTYMFTAVTLVITNISKYHTVATPGAAEAVEAIVSYPCASPAAHTNPTQYAVIPVIVLDGELMAAPGKDHLAAVTLQSDAKNTVRAKYILYHSKKFMCVGLMMLCSFEFGMTKYI